MVLAQHAQLIAYHAPMLIHATLVCQALSSVIQLVLLHALTDNMELIEYVNHATQPARLVLMQPLQHVLLANPISSYWLQVLVVSHNVLQHSSHPMAHVRLARADANNAQVQLVASNVFPLRFSRVRFAKPPAIQDTLQPVVFAQAVQLDAVNALMPILVAPVSMGSY